MSDIHSELTTAEHAAAADLGTTDPTPDEVAEGDPSYVEPASDAVPIPEGEDAA